MTAARAISGFGKAGDVRAAIGELDKLKRSGAALNALVYNCLLDACVQNSRMSLALAYFKEVKELGLADLVTYNTVMKGHVASGAHAAARGLLPEMERQGIAANRITYHGLLNAAIQCKDYSGMWELVTQMELSGLTVNAITCSTLLKSITCPSQAPELARVMKLVDRDETAMDEVLVCSVLEACIRTGSLDLLSEHAERYAREGGLGKLTTPMYGSMIKAYGKAGRVDEIWRLWEQMAACGVIPTPIALGCMVEALVMNTRVEDAWLLAQKVWEDESQRASVNTVIYSTILKGFVMTEQSDRVAAVYEEMKERGIPRNKITYNTMMNALARGGLMHRARQLLEEMRASDPPVEPDIITYSTVMKGYCAEGNLDKSLELLREMKSEGKFAPDEVMYNSLLDGCAKQRRLNDALRLLDEMRASGVTPTNYTLSILLKLLSREKRLEQAFSLVETITAEYGFKPNIQVYTCLIQACFHNQQVRKALALHDEIARSGHCTPDQKTYAALARGCLHAGAVKQAAEVVRCAYHLSGHGMVQPGGHPVGMEPACLKDVLAGLGPNSPAARQLAEDVRGHRPLPARRPCGTAMQRRGEAALPRAGCSS